MDNRTIANWLVVIFMFMYWVFRIVVTYMYATGREFVAQPLNQKYEIILLFVTLVCIILVVKEKPLGNYVYAISYILYFGTDLYKSIKTMIENYSFTLFTDQNQNTLFSAVAVVLAIVVLLDLLYENMKRPEDKKTEWFYTNDKLTKQTDDREDKNHYRLN